MVGFVRGVVKKRKVSLSCVKPLPEGGLKPTCVYFLLNESSLWSEAFSCWIKIADLLTWGKFKIQTTCLKKIANAG